MRVAPARSRCQLYSHLQHEATRSKDEESSATAKEARERAFEEAEAADRRREAAERRELELLDSVASLDRQAREHGGTTLTPTHGLSSHEAELCALGRHWS